MFLQLNDCNIPTEKEIYELINEHDKFIDKDVKKKLGQPNIYSLFMHWGISHLRTNGTMSFIVPQSIRSGLYFKNLREKMKELRIKLSRSKLMMGKDNNYMFIINKKSEMYDVLEKPLSAKNT